MSLSDEIRTVIFCVEHEANKRYPQCKRRKENRQLGTKADYPFENIKEQYIIHSLSMSVINLIVRIADVIIAQRKQ